MSSIHRSRWRFVGSWSDPRAVRAAVWLAWLVVIGCVAGASLPLAAARPSTRVSVWCRSLLPQGWGFFTRDAEEPVLRVYARDGDRWRCRDRPLASPTNWFGLRRDQRLRDAEVARLVGEIGEDDWVPCRGEVTGCWPLDRPPAAVMVTPARHPTVSGDLLLQVQERLPWAWGSARHRVDMPSRVVRVTVNEEVRDAS